MREAASPGGAASSSRPRAVFLADTPTRHAGNRTHHGAYRSDSTNLVEAA